MRLLVCPVSAAPHWLCVIALSLETSKGRVRGVVPESRLARVNRVRGPHHTRTHTHTPLTSKLITALWRPPLLTRTVPPPQHGRARARVARVVGDAHEDRHVASLRVATLGRCGQRAWVGFGFGCGCGFGFGFGLGFGLASADRLRRELGVRRAADERVAGLGHGRRRGAADEERDARAWLGLGLGSGLG